METARDYLMRESQGEKFEMVDLPSQRFGVWAEEGYRNILYLAPIPEEQISDSWIRKLSFVNNPDSEIDYFTDELVLVATPRSPRGPFTVSVYSDTCLIGWLDGAGLEEFAVKLVNDLDQGSALIFDTDLKWVGEADEERNAFLMVRVDLKPNLWDFIQSKITSTKLAPPSQLEWSNGENVLPIRPSCSLEEDEEFPRVRPINPRIVSKQPTEESSYFFTGDAGLLVPHVWEHGSHAVTLFVDDVEVGPIADLELSRAIFELLVKPEQHRLGIVNFVSVEMDEHESWQAFIAASVRDLIRVDWDFVKSSLDVG
jgi:hypothetical protein